MDAYLNEVLHYLFAQSWQIALLTVTVAVLTFALRRRSAHVRYLLWMIVLAKCFVPPLHPVPLRVLPEAVPEVIPSLWSASSENRERPRLLEEAAPGPASPSRPAPASFPAALPRTEHRLSASDWLGIAWALGAVAYLLLNLLRALRGHYWIRRSRRPLPAHVQAETENLLRAYGTRRTPPLWLIEGVGQPFVWGLVRGSIYVPPDFLSIESPQQRRDILGHELGHVLRYDAAVNTLQVVAQGLFWFHPLVWWANKKARQEREKVCDEMAVARLGSRPKEYSTAIVSALIHAQESTRPVPSLAVAGPVKNLEERIKTMLMPGKKFYKRPSLVDATTVLLVAILTIPTALVLTSRAQTEPPKARTDSSQTLHQAAAAGDIEQVQEILAQRADVNEKNKDGSTPLHEAAGNGWRDVARLLLEKGANVETADTSGQTPLHRASRFASRHICALLLAKGASVNTRDNRGNTPLHAAMGRQEVDRSLFELLLAKGADVKARNEQGETPLHLACRARKVATYTQQREEAADVLLAHGAEVDATDKSGRTPLHVGAENGQDKVVRLLLAKGADVSSTQSDGRTALHLAAGTGENSIVEALIARGADVKARDVRGETPVGLAARMNRKDTVRLLLDKGAEVSTIQIAAYIGDLDAVKGFLERKGNVTAQNKYLTSTLWVAALGGQKDVAAFLISKGASVNVEDVERVRMGALHYAATGGSKEVAELLIANGAEVNAKAQGDATPLHRAALSGAKDVALLLIDHGADVNAEAAGKWRPLDMAVKDVVKLLIDKGADPSTPDNLLFKACRQGDKDLAGLAIQKGANVNSKVWGEEDAPALEAMWSGYTKATKPADIPRMIGILKLLLDNGANPNTKDADWYLLHYAAQEAEVTRILLDKGANPNVIDKTHGQSPLHVSATKGCKPAVELLVARGADPNLKDYDGRTPLALARENGHTVIVEFLQQHGAKE